MRCSVCQTLSRNRARNVSVSCVGLHAPLSEEARVLDFYDLGDWYYTNKNHELADSDEVAKACLLPWGGGIQPEKYHPRKWRSQLSGLYQRCRELPSKAIAYYKKDLMPEEDGREVKKMIYTLVKQVSDAHVTAMQPHSLGDGVEGPFWDFFGTMARLKDVPRKGPIVCSGAAKMQQEVVRSVGVLHHMHAPGSGSEDIPLHIFNLAKLEANYFNSVANIGRPPSLGTSGLAVDTADNVLTVVNKRMLTNLRGVRVTGSEAKAMLNGMSAENIEKWFVEEGAPLVRANVVRLSVQSNGFSIEKREVPPEQHAKEQMRSILLQHANLSLQEYEASCMPLPKKKRTAGAAAVSSDASDILSKRQQLLHSTPGMTLPLGMAVAVPGRQPHAHEQLVAQNPVSAAAHVPMHAMVSASPVVAPCITASHGHLNAMANASPVTAQLFTGPSQPAQPSQSDPAFWPTQIFHPHAAAGVVTRSPSSHLAHTGHDEVMMSVSQQAPRSEEDNPQRNCSNEAVSDFQMPPWKH